MQFWGKKSQIEISGLKNITTGVENSVDGFNSRLDVADKNNQWKGKSV